VGTHEQTRRLRKLQEQSIQDLVFVVAVEERPMVVLMAAVAVVAVVLVAEEKMVVAPLVQLAVAGVHLELAGLNWAWWLSLPDTWGLFML
jgi:hypothetical protein